MNETTVKFSLVDTTKSVLEGTDTTEGSIYFTSDTGELYYDFNSNRVQITDFVIVNTETERAALIAPLNKFYYILDTGILWLYKDGEWYNNTTDLTTYATIEYVDESLKNKQDSITDTDTIVVDETGLNALGMLEKNTGTAVFDWVGTEEEWLEQRQNGTIKDSWICFVTDDDTIFVNTAIDDDTEREETPTL